MDERFIEESTSQQHYSVSDLGTSSWAGSWAAPNGLGLLAKLPKPATTNILDSGYEQLGLDLDGVGLHSLRSSSPSVVHPSSVTARSL
jgi:hypothetical protein